MPSPEQRLLAAAIVLPAAPQAGGNYLSAKTVGSLVFLAGAISADEHGVITGTVGADRTVQQGYDAARRCALIQMAVLRRHLGSLDAVQQVVSVNGYVNAVPAFAESPAVLNGFSDAWIEVFGDAGRHVRAAVGVSALPRNALVEVQMTVAIYPEGAPPLG